MNPKPSTSKPGPPKTFTNKNLNVALTKTTQSVGTSSQSKFSKLNSYFSHFN